MMGGILLDANVLIDYQNHQNILGVLPVAGFQLFVIDDVLEEAEKRERYYDEFPFLRIHPTQEQRLLAEARPRALTHQDMLCVVCATEYGLSCATNDRRLRKELEKHGIALHSTNSLLELAHDSSLITEEAYEACSYAFGSRLYSY